MRYDKDEHERLIDSSPLFSLDPEKESASYQSEKLKMVKCLYCYLMAVNANQFERYAVEIVATAERCIKNYDPSSGRFLNYFTAAWKKTCGHLVGREMVEETFQGIRFTEMEARNLKKYMRLAQAIGFDTESPEFEKKVAEAMGTTASEAAKLCDMVRCKPTFGSRKSGEGEEYSLIDQLDGGSYADADLLQAETAKELLNLIELVFDQLQERQKPMLAMQITSKLALWASEEENLLALIRQKSFFDESAFEASCKRGSPMQAKEIAARFGVLEASASRSWSAFQKKVRSNLYPCLLKL